MWYRIWKPIFGGVRKAPLGQISGDDLKVMVTLEPAYDPDTVNTNSIRECCQFLRDQGYVIKAEKEMQVK